MGEIRLGLGRRDLKRNRWTIGGMGVVCAAVGAAIWWLPANRTSTQPNPDRGAWLLGIAVFWILLAVYMINQARGATYLAPDHIRLQSFVKRRSIPWNEVTRFEERQRHNRGGPYWDVRVHRTKGRPLTMPGLFTSGRRDPEFDENLVKLHTHWASAKGTSLLPPG
ncbi:hypothetical protein [Streptomyces sp. NPDC056227]|uniref:hypothetical protein n=1 Tax=Streptomyces sp. NPDC056227 TaxID=3345753 RepID=UPI0035D84071